MTLRLAVDLLMIGFGVSEVVLAMTLRSRSGASSATDRGSLRTLWLTISAAIMAAYVVPAYRPLPLPGSGDAYRIAALLLMTLGLVIRWNAILTLRRAFTVDVAIAHDQHVVTSGPYRVVRHPSYTGLLLVFVGMALAHRDAIALLVMLVPILLAMRYRIHVEEQALTRAFGAEYENYAQRTKRLLPGLW